MQFIVIFVILSNCWLLAAAINLLHENNSKYCHNIGLLRKQDGLIISHKNYGKKLYPNNIHCQWFILAPFDYKIVVQATKFSLEDDINCGFDRVKYYEGFVGTSETLLAIGCGSKADYIVKSKTNKMTIDFKSDAYLNKLGFVLRYRFVKDARSGANNGSVGASCQEWEFQCPKEKRCINQSWKCDGIVDCDNAFDEQHCDQVCTQNQFKCFKFGDCIPNYYQCDGTEDCLDGSDEMKCIVKKDTIKDLEVPLKRLNATINCAIQEIEPDLPKVIINGEDDISQIVGGKRAKRGSWPWMISFELFGRHDCGGTLLEDDIILTAAHCFYGRGNIKNWKVNAGRHRVIETEVMGQVRNIAKLVMHENYDSLTNANDIAIVKVDRPFNWTNYVTKACLSSAFEELPVGKLCIITGWGKTQGTSYRNYLNQAAVPILNNTICEKAFESSFDEISMFCAGFYKKGEIDACSGDSGGPLLCKSAETGTYSKVFGITSWGEGCALRKKPGVYTNVVNLLPWLRREIKNI